MTDKELMQEALKWHDHIKALANDHADDELYQTRSKVFDWLIEQAEKAEKYREALEQIANSDGWLIEPNPLCTVDEAYGRCVEKARKALEGENNE